MIVFRAILAVLVLAASITPVFAQVLPESAKHGSVVILKAVIMKDGDTCIGVTKKAGHPLSEEGCEKLLASTGRKATLVAPHPMMQITIRPQFQVGDQLFYVKSGKKKQKGWVLKPIPTKVKTST